MTTQLQPRHYWPAGSQVHKFGGTSLADASRFKAVAAIIKQQQLSECWVVVSAPGKTTDQLCALLELADSPSALSRAIEQLGQSLQQLVMNTLTGAWADEVLAQLQSWLAALPTQIQTGQQVDALALGESLSALLLSRLLRQLGVCADWLDSRHFLTVEHHQIRWDESEQRLQAQRGNGIQIVTGFIARDPAGNSLTLGRNGSDYSATILGRLIQAEQVHIWTDVDAIYSGDPRRFTAAIPYRQVSWRQACLLAQLGNPVLHARTLAPLQNSQTRLEVRSSFQPERSGCQIVPQQDCTASFVTDLSKVVLLSVHDTHGYDADWLARELHQPVIELSHTAEGHLWLVPQAVASKAVQLLAELDVHAVHDTQPYYAVAWLKPKQAQREDLPADVQACIHALQPLHVYQTKVLAIWLFDTELSTMSLSELHDCCTQPRPSIQIIVAGTGNVGAEFLKLLPGHQQKIGIKARLEVAALFNSRQMLFAPELESLDVEGILQQAEPLQHQALLAYIAQLDSPKVLIDLTPSQQLAERYPEFITAGCHIISANKQGVTLPQSHYQAIVQQLADHQLKWLSNTTVGAGLPVQRTIQELLSCGDRIQRISGIFSGTLSWLLCKYDGSTPFSELLLQAKELGYTEPDPREDLSGRDVQRKLLVLARELGLSLDLEHIKLTPLLPETMAGASWDAFWQQRADFDALMQATLHQAQQQQQVLRYTGELEITAAGVRAEVKLVAVSADNALAGIQPCDNIFVIHSEWYQDTGLVIQGPGAGRTVTAGGVHADLAHLVRQFVVEKPCTQTELLLERQS